MKPKFTKNKSDNFQFLIIDCPTLKMTEFKERSLRFDADDHDFGDATVNRTLSPATERQAMAVLALSHTKLEHDLYEIMFNETRNSHTRIGEFSIRFLCEQSKVFNYPRVQRARNGLTMKMSIEAQTVASATRRLSIYMIYHPTEIFERRRRAGISMPSEVMWSDDLTNSNLCEVVERVVEKHNLSRREAQVALRCAEGMTNAQIGEKLLIHQETVKFHLRNIFIKFGVKRRTELVAHLYKH